VKRFRAVERSPRLPEEVVSSLSAAIAKGELRPGDKLPSEFELAADFGVARTVVREAISQLKYDGVIESRQGVGAFVAQPDKRTAFRISPQCFEKRRELLKLLKVRTGIAAEAAAEAARLRQPDQLEAMRQCVTEMQASVAAQKPDAEARYEAELRLYRTIAEASANEMFASVMAMIDGQIAANLKSVAVKNAKAAEWGEAVILEHQRIVDAIERGDEASAREETRQHFERAAQRLAERADFADV
jgi:GntR family transcriptional repressor for pyruvate dehydrogenase complex